MRHWSLRYPVSSENDIPLLKDNLREVFPPVNVVLPPPVVIVLPPPEEDIADPLLLLPPLLLELPPAVVLPVVCDSIEVLVAPRVTCPVVEATVLVESMTK